MTLKPKLYGLLGFPIQHSLSPCMHNAAFSFLKIKAKYKLFELPAKRLEDFLDNLKKNNICGFNVTIPYKEKVLPYLNSKSFGVRQIGAVNTVVIKDGKLKGFNTDFAGFLQHVLPWGKVK
jgi:shikimate dehydrogenase